MADWKKIEEDLDSLSPLLIFRDGQLELKQLAAMLELDLGHLPDSYEKTRLEILVPLLEKMPAAIKNLNDTIGLINTLISSIKRARKKETAGT